MNDAAGLIDPVDLALPDWPAGAPPLRLAHLSDLHVRGRVQRRHLALGAALRADPPDLICLTGDYMTNPGHEGAAYETLARVLDGLRPGLGVFGVFGNHDSDALIERCGDLPVRWLRNEAVRVEHAGVEIELSGLHIDKKRRPDGAELAASMGAMRGEQEGLGDVMKSVRPSAHRISGDAVSGGRRFRLMLAHLPMALPLARDLGVDLLLSGHTHGGQIRLPGPRLLVNSCDMPLDKSTGVLRMGATMAAVSRGLGEVGLPMRLFCPAHCPVYTVTHGVAEGHAANQGLCSVRTW
ncbi:MAG: metallophosphoesterase [Planctomycetota bacterium]